MCNEKLNRIKELESLLKHVINPKMTLDDKIKALQNSFWCVHNSGYCNYIAGQLMAGIENDQTIKHDLDTKYKYEIEELIDLLIEYQKELNN